MPGRSFCSGCYFPAGEIAHTVATGVSSPSVSRPTSREWISTTVSSGLDPSDFFFSYFRRTVASVVSLALWYCSSFAPGSSKMLSIAQSWS